MSYSAALLLCASACLNSAVFSPRREDAKYRQDFLSYSAALLLCASACLNYAGFTPRREDAKYRQDFDGTLCKCFFSTLTKLRMSFRVEQIQRVFTKAAQPEIAAGQAAYMKNQFAFHGIKTPLRRKLQKPFLQKEALPAQGKLEAVVQKLWALPEREYQYFAQELVRKYARRFHVGDLAILEYMITTKPWWDTVDFIASHLVAEYFRKYPELRSEVTSRWLDSGNIWLQRSTMLFQLHYKEETDYQFLALVINRLLGSNEFFINKAIGWALRQYARIDPYWVKNFAARTELNSLSRREALKHL